jgi:hypothetical protein
MEVEMKKFQLAALLPALSFALALPTLAAAGTSQDTQGSVRTDQVAQSQAEQPRLPAEKEGASSNTAQSPSGMSPDSSSTTSKKSAAKTQADKGQVDQKKAKKHPPTAAMDSATPEKSGTPGKHPATSTMDRATPDQKSPEPTSTK